MHLKLEELQRVAKKTIKEERQNSSLREEFVRLFGPPVAVSCDASKVAQAVNECIDVLDATGKEFNRRNVRVSMLTEATYHPSPEVRKAVARILPERFVEKFLDDPASEVRCAAAKRLPLSVVSEGARRHPRDDQMKSIVRSRKRLEEAGLPDAKRVDEPFDINGDGPLGDVVKQDMGDELSDEWYDLLARKLCREYGNNLEGNWEEILATRVVASHYSTTGVRMDRDKLLNAIHNCIKEREDEILGEGSLKSIAARLLREAVLEETAAMPAIDESVDEITALLESPSSAAEYVDAAEKIFGVKKSTVPAGIKKYRIGEGRLSQALVPMKCRVPGGRQIDPTVERALDRYVECWNSRQELSGEPYRISWSNHPEDASTIGFRLELK